MSESAIEALESEAFESDGEAAYEAAYEGEGTGEAGESSEAAYEGYEGYGEDARSDARRRARWRQRQIMLARQRQLARPQPARSQPARRPAVPTASQAARAVRAEVRSLDLETKVALDAMRRRLDEANRMAIRNAWAAEASVAASQALDSFHTGLGSHDWAKALIRGVPTLLIAPGKPRRPGVEGVLLDPRVAGGALLAGIWAVGHFRGSTHGVASVVFGGPATVAVGGTGSLSGYPVDKKGNVVQGVTVTWSSPNGSILKVGADGTFTAVAAGTATVFATAGGVSSPGTVTVG